MAIPIEVYEPSTKIPPGTAEEKLVKYGKSEKKLGSGTYGEVTKHRDPRTMFLDEYVAIKSMKSNKQGVREATLREIACVLRLDHPNIINFTDVFATLDKTYVVMPLATSDLRNIQDSDKIDPKRLAYQVISGVGYCLSRGVLNRDIKPENILVFGVAPDVTLKIADFGLARSLRCSTDTGITNEVYSLWYRPPEVILGGRYDDSADIWAVGCILYYIYARRALFQGDNANDMIHRMAKEYGPLEVQWKDIVDMPNWSDTYNLKKTTYYLDPPYTVIPDDVRGIILSLLKIDPNQRSSLADTISNPYFDFGNKSTKGGSVRDVKLDALVTGCSCTSQLYLREPPVPQNLLGSAKLDNYIASEIWMATVATNFKLSVGTISLSYLLFEEYVVRTAAPTNKWELIICTCMNIASKYHEVYSPVLSDFSDATEYAITEDEIKECEIDLLTTLNFDLFLSTAADFVVGYAGSGRYTQEAKDFSKRILPIVHIASLPDILPPSSEALAALFIGCTQTGCTFKHTSRLTSQILKLVENTYAMIKSSRSQTIEHITMTKVGDIVVTSTVL